MATESNGRVNILGPNTPYQFTLFKNPGMNGESDKITSYNNALTGNWTNSLLSNTFFSKANQIIIQNGIRAGVFKVSNGRYNVGPQDETNLKIVMRSIFLQNAKNDPRNIQQQIILLNNLVYEYCIPQVFSEATSYIKYRNDVSVLAVPGALPIYSNIKGSKQLELKPWF